MAQPLPPHSIARIREHLKALADIPRSDKKGTLQAVAQEYHLPIGKLRKFREGDDAAISRPVLAAWNRMLGSDATIAGVGSDALAWAGAARNWYATMMQEDQGRVAMLELYEQIERTRGEASRASDAWADICCTGSAGESAGLSTHFFPMYRGESKREEKALVEVGRHINHRVFPDQQKWLAARGMAKYGDQFAQALVAREGGRPTLVGLANMPVKTMFVNRDEQGLIDVRQAYVQRVKGRHEPVAVFPAWKIAHFRNQQEWGAAYGASIFQSNTRAYIQLESLEAGLIIRRLSRAPQRYKYVLDVRSVGTQDEIEKFVNDKRRELERTPTIDGDVNFRTQRINMPPDEDVFVAKRDKDSPADVQVLEGDASIGELGDFNHFFAKWLAGLGVPKAHLGYEGDTQRSVGTELHIVFARRGRRFQVNFNQGLYHLYWLELILRGRDPRMPFVIVPPSLGTRDELVRAQVLMALATTVRYLSAAFSATGQVPSTQWFLRYVMGLDPWVIKELELVDVMQLDKSAASGEGPATTKSSEEMAEAALQGASRDPALLSEIARARFMINETAIQRQRPDLLRGATPEQAAVFEPVLPFGGQVDEIARMLGVPELRRE